MKTFTFDIDALRRDIQIEPYQNNVVLGKRYGISRERVRQIRQEFGLPNVKDAKEQWVRDNFDVFTDAAKEGKFITNTGFMTKFMVSTKAMLLILSKNPDLQKRYDDAVADWKQKVYHPTEKSCTVCKVVKPIDDFYKSTSDGTRDGYARICKSCNIESVKAYYEIRKSTPKKTPEYKYCSAVPEVGLLPASQFRKMKTANTGLQPQCNVYQDFYLRFRKEGEVEQAREMAKVATIAYYKGVDKELL